MLFSVYHGPGSVSARFHLYPWSREGVQGSLVFQTQTPVCCTTKALLFFQLPYLIDGAHRLTQSNAILRYIARKHNMCKWGWGTHAHSPGLGWSGMLRVSLCCVATGGETEEEKIRVDILENQTMDVRLHMARICYSPDFVSPLPLGWVAQSLNARQGPIYTGPFAI